MDFENKHTKFGEAARLVSAALCGVGGGTIGNILSATCMALVPGTGVMALIAKAGTWVTCTALGFVAAETANARVCEDIAIVEHVLVRTKESLDEVPDPEKTETE